MSVHISWAAGHPQYSSVIDAGVTLPVIGLVTFHSVCYVSFIVGNLRTTLQGGCTYAALKKERQAIWSQYPPSNLKVRET